MIERKKFYDVKKAVKEATEKTAFEYGKSIASQAKALAPVREGQLRNSISVVSLDNEALLNDSGGEKAEGLETKGLKKGEVYVGSNVDHATAQEYGIDTSADGRRMASQPYLRPARELVGSDEVAKIMKKWNKIQMEDARRANAGRKA